MTIHHSEARADLVLVDTSAWICFFARKSFPEIKKAMLQLLEEDRVAIAGPILVELLQGTRTPSERDKTKRRLAAVHWLTITDEQWQQAAVLCFKLRRKGVTVSVVDALIAEVAMYYKCELLHFDEDYTYIAKHSLLNLFDLDPFRN